MSDASFAAPRDVSADADVAVETLHDEAPPTPEVDPLAPDADGVMYTQPRSADDPVELTMPTPEQVAPLAPLPVRPPRRGRLGAGAVAGVAAGALLVGLAGGVGGAWLYDEYGPTSAGLVAAAPTGQSVPPPAGSVAAIAAAITPSVVSIEATDGGVRASTGSGLIISADGYILTNNHVVEFAEGGGSVSVLLSDGSVVQGTIEGTSPEYDLAVIKIDVDGLTPLVFGDSDAILVGDQVIAIGSPLGLDSTVTTGIISAMHRPVTTGSDSGETAFLDALQTDAAINPGNSGGPLLNSNGEVIGINSAVAALPGATQSTGAGSVGLGFAIPSNVAYRVAQELIETGEATVPVMGAVLDTSYTGSGVKIADAGANPGEPAVAPGSPADIAGILAGDVITHINGRPVSRADEVVVAVRSLAPGDSVAVTVETDGEPREVTVTVVASTEISYGDGADAESTQD